jgi:hypothetical protein
MPNETPKAIEWALTQKDWANNPIDKNNSIGLVDKVRQYFNDNGVTYVSFSYSDLKPYLN